MRAVARKLRAREIESVAICLINAHMNPAHERRAREILLEELPGLHVSLSTDILPEPPEFERTATTVANAYCAPVLRNYMDTLEEGLGEAGLQGRRRARHAQRRRHDDDRLRQGRGRQDAELGPGGRRDRGRGGRGLGGPLERRRLRHGRHERRHRRRARRRAAAHDARSTSSGACRSASRASTSISIGAGGGSIAWLDPAGYPRSGPQSAGADPGPACYGKGGTEPTNTDAQLVLGRVSNDLFLEGRMQLDVERSAEALRRTIAEPLGLSLEDAAEGVLRIANANMVKAIRLVTVERGFDPREFGLVAFGGAGALHARRPRARAADARGDRAAVPRRDERHGAAVRRSARRLLLGVRPARARDRHGRARDASTRRWPSAWSATSSARASTRAEIAVENAVDIRYVGQLHSVTVPLPEISASGFTAAVGELPRRAPAPVPLLAPRVAGRDLDAAHHGARGAREARPELDPARRHRPRGAGRARAQGALRRARLGRHAGARPHRPRRPETPSTGPCIVEELDSTVVLPPGTSAAVDAVGNILITLHPDAEVSR